MIFQPFYKDHCPMCLNVLIRSGDSAVYYACPEKHYTCAEYYYNPKYHSWVYLSKFMIEYHTPAKTDICIIERDPNKITENYSYVFSVMDYFPINWNNPNQTERRISSLITFS